jgi:predicted DsbA family dithiol-disulfide isomerase
MKYSPFVLLLSFGIFLMHSGKLEAQNTKEEKMKVEVWSDVVCPFCYIGKTHFDEALAQFAQKENIEFVWKSFQLNPDLETNTEQSLYEHLAESKGISLEQAEGMGIHAALMGKAAGIELNFDKSVVANSFNSHRLIHFAKANGKQQEMKSCLFKAYFTEGKNIDDTETLITLAKEIGLNADEARSVLESDKYASDVKDDINESQQLGVRGVPFFVFDRKYAISGAQPTEAFLETLEKAFAEWRKANPTVQLQVSEGAVCEPNKACD